MSAAKCIIVHMPTVPGHRWADCREELDMDQGSAAVALGISKRTLQNLETVTGYYVSGRVIHRAARLYRCSPDYLKGLTDYPQPRLKQAS